MASIPLCGQNGGCEKRHEKDACIRIVGIVNVWWSGFPIFRTSKINADKRISIFGEIGDKRIVGSADGRESTFGSSSKIQGVREIGIQLLCPFLFSNLREKYTKMAYCVELTYTGVITAFIIEGGIRWTWCQTKQLRHKHVRSSLASKTCHYAKIESTLFLAPRHLSFVELLWARVGART